MSISDKLTCVAENVRKVFEAGKKMQYDEFWDEYQNGGKRTNYSNAFGGTSWTQGLLEQIKYPVKFIAETATHQCFTKGIFQYLNWGGTTPVDMTDILSKFDFSDCQRTAMTFSNAYVKNVTLDLGNCDSVDRMFNCADAGGRTCENVTLKVSSKCKNYNQAFHYCSGLTEIRFTDGSEIAANISFQQSTKLTNASITSIINALSKNTSGLTVTLSKTAVNNAFSDDEWNALVSTKQNWTISLV